MAHARPPKPNPPVDPNRDHVLGNPEAELTLVEYGSYACQSCHAAHEVIADLRDRFGQRMRYVFRHRPLDADGNARRAAELAEHVFQTTGEFWPIHDVLMKRGPAFTSDEFEAIARKFDLPSPDDKQAWAAASARFVAGKDGLPPNHTQTEWRVRGAMWEMQPLDNIFGESTLENQTLLTLQLSEPSDAGADSAQAATQKDPFGDRSQFTR